MPDAGALSRAIQSGVAPLEKAERQGDSFSTRTLSSGFGKSLMKPDEGQPAPVWAEDRPLPEEEKLGAPIQKIYVYTSMLRPEINALAREMFSGKQRITRKALIELRRKIWNLALTQGRLAYVLMKLVPFQAEMRASVLRIDVIEIKARQILIEETGEAHLSEAAKARLRADVAHAFAKGNVLDLEALDANIQHRLRLGDHTVRVSLVPVGATEMDIKVLVGDLPEQETTYMSRYDNIGMRSFGRDRTLAMMSTNETFLPGDRLDALALKTADFGNGEFLHGVVFGRLAYEAPVPSWDVRLAGWTSAMHYRAVEAVTNDSKTNGEAYEIGTGVIKPLMTGKTSFVDGRVDFLSKIQVDRFDDTTVLDRKQSYQTRATVSGQKALSATQQVEGEAALSAGDLNVSGVRSYFVQDKAGPHTQGVFSKMTMRALWRALFGAEKQIDTQASVTAQAAADNLDSSEKISLGGESGLRAFGPGEASGDHGFVSRAEVGYTPVSWGRFSAFYDLGGIQRYASGYNPQDTVPSSYLLQDAGVGVGLFYRNVQMTTVFAHQFGANPGLATDGRDSDNLKDRYRVWSSVSVRY